MGVEVREREGQPGRERWTEQTRGFTGNSHSETHVFLEMDRLSRSPGPSEPFDILSQSAGQPSE